MYHFWRDHPCHLHTFICGDVRCVCQTTPLNHPSATAAPLPRWNGWKWGTRCLPERGIWTTESSCPCPQRKRATVASTCARQQTQRERTCTTLTCWWKVSQPAGCNCALIRAPHPVRLLSKWVDSEVQVLGFFLSVCFFDSPLHKFTLRASQLAKRASPGPADHDWLRCSHQVRGQREALTRHHVEKKRRIVPRWVALIPAAGCVCVCAVCLCWVKRQSGEEPLWATCTLTPVVAWIHNKFLSDFISKACRLFSFTETQKNLETVKNKTKTLTNFWSSI